MSAKGFDNGNGPADRLLEWLRDYRHFQANELTQVRNRLRAIQRAERNRTIASLRGRLSRISADLPGTDLRGVTAILDEMESA